MAGARPWPRSAVFAIYLLGFAAVCAILFLGRVVLIPLALATLLSFLLSPLVVRLQRWGLPRIPAVILVVAAAAAAIGGIGWVVTSEVVVLANQLPAYKSNIKDKITDLKSMFRGGAFAKVQSTITDINAEIEEEDGPEESAAAPGRPSDGEPLEEKGEEQEPTPVEIQPSQGPFGADTTTIVPVLGVLANGGAVAVLVIFMLINREDLRNRVVSLGGHSSLAVTTKALDEAAKRISRFLLAQFLLNASFGLAVGIGLLVIGVPYAALWGLCAALLRYVPYLGPIAASALPILVSVVTSTGWSQVAFVVALFVVLELFSNNVMEPWLYGHSVGLSAVAVIVAALFWTWLWGPVGLMLATPLTVCLAVLGKYVPALQFFDRMLSEKPALAPHVWLYHRLLARDRGEANEILVSAQKDRSRAEIADELLLPALQLARSDADGDRIAREDEQYVEESLREMIVEIHASPDAEAASSEPAPAAEDQRLDPASGDKVIVAGFPFRHQGEELALAMLAGMFEREKEQFRILSADLLLSEKIAALEQVRPACICLTAMHPTHLMHVRQLCKRLRTKFPSATLYVGCFGYRGDFEKARKLLRSGGADWVVDSLSEMQQRVEPLLKFHARTPGAFEEAVAEAAAATNGNNGVKKETGASSPGEPAPESSLVASSQPQPTL